MENSRTRDFPTPPHDQDVIPALHLHHTLARGEVASPEVVAPPYHWPQPRQHPRRLLTRSVHSTPKPQSRKHLVAGCMLDEPSADEGGLCILSRHCDKGGHWQVASQVARSRALAERVLPRETGRNLVGRTNMEVFEICHQHPHSRRRIGERSALTGTSGAGRNRTADASLFRAALYRLSYRPRSAAACRRLATPLAPLNLVHTGGKCKRFLLPPVPHLRAEFALA